MKTIDFTQPGRIPFTQPRFGYLQTAWQEAVQALAAIGSSPAANVATVLYGMQSSTAGGTTTVSAGWFVYNGVPIRFPSQTYASAVAGGDAVYVVVTPTSTTTPQPYYSGATPDVIDDETGVLTVLANTTPADGTHFLLGAMLSWGPQWVDASGGTYGVTADLGTAAINTITYSKYLINHKTFTWNFFAELNLAAAQEIIIDISEAIPIITTDSGNYTCWINSTPCMCSLYSHFLVVSNPVLTVSPCPLFFSITCQIE